MVTLSLPGKNHPNNPCRWFAFLVCFLFVLCIFIPDTHAKFGMSALPYATFSQYDWTDNVCKSRSVTAGTVKVIGSLTSSIQVSGYDRIARFPHHRHDHSILETLTLWALQPFLYFLRNPKILYVFLLILLVSYLIYLNVPPGIRLFKSRNWK